MPFVFFVNFNRNHFLFPLHAMGRKRFYSINPFSGFLQAKSEQQSSNPKQGEENISHIMLIGLLVEIRETIGNQL